MSARFKLTNDEGETYLERWGWECKWFGFFVHHITGPDPGRDLHDHPWWFGSLVVKGAYQERRANVRTPLISRGTTRKRWSWKSLPRTVCHTIMYADPNTWTLVLHGPRRGTWGFYAPSGWTEWHDYADTANVALGEVD